MRYAELRCKSNYSLHRGASFPSELIQQASALGYTALALTDLQCLGGVVSAHIAAKSASFHLIIGCEIHPIDASPVVLWVADRNGYGNLCRLLSRGRLVAAKGECRVTLADVAEHSTGLLAGVPLLPLLQPSTMPKPQSFSKVPQTPGLEFIAAARPRIVGSHQDPLVGYQEAFGDRCYALAELFGGPCDEPLLETMLDAARRRGLPVACANDVHYHHPSRQDLHEVLTAIRLKTTVADLRRDRPPNAERRLKSPTEMASLFAARPALLECAAAIADCCRFSMEELQYRYPAEACPPGESPSDYLARLTSLGAAKRYPRGIPAKVQHSLQHELTLIRELQYETYFLTVWDVVRFARSQGILCQGRGSAANSAVCYCLGVTEVDPERIDLLVERFISKERNEAPDIDIDFEHERRDEVLQYIYQKYGRDHASLTAVSTCYRPRSALRDVGKAMGFSLDRIDAFAKQIDWYDSDGVEKRSVEAGFDGDSKVNRRFIDLVQTLVGFPRHLSQHPGGMIISEAPIYTLAPIENARMENRTVVSWDKYDLDALGILKVDCLGLGMLTMLRKCFALIREHWGREMSLANLPHDDPEVYRMLQAGDAIGTFQVESRAQLSMLPRLKPSNFFDLVVEVAIVRPGPIQGQMVHPYLRRRNGNEKITYPTPGLAAILEPTLGVPLFQEQVMRVAMEAAGFTAGEADELRRAMAAWGRSSRLKQFKEKLIVGMRERGLCEEFAHRLYKQIEGFAGYGFPMSHAASFANLVYASAWCKRHYHAAFTAALLNSQPMGFYAPAQLVYDAREHDVEIRPPDVNISRWDCTLEPSRKGMSLRLGLRLVKNLAEEAAERIADRRSSRPYHSLADLADRAELNRRDLSALANADALNSFSVDRRLGLWQALAGPPNAAAMLREADVAAPEANPGLVPPHEWEQVHADYSSIGLTLRRHPLAFLRKELAAEEVATSAEFRATDGGRALKIAGLVLFRQRPETAKGICFITLEDETGVANLIVRPLIWEQYRRFARSAVGLVAHGRVERVDRVVHLLVVELSDLTSRLVQLSSRSRDFR